ncbi:type 1 glutamine amidotransferase domain-containing protein [Craterilacuibacter sp.]|uniref:type 1 glutamine amidotransferase domain-containing protein n=1 Tax=Craterilacuibacter sp. TaxID=2870909 RepID=UPI003F31C697
MKRVLFVLTSHDKLGDTGHRTGFWIEEFAAPYYLLADAGVDVTLASPLGLQPPIDPKSALPEFQTPATVRFNTDAVLQDKLAHTTKLTEVEAADFDAVFYPGGHGPLWDLTNDEASILLLQAFDRLGKPIAAVCHAPAVLLHAKKADGSPLVAGRHVTGFTNGEEEAVGLTHVVPFLLEDALKDQGGLYAKGPDWGAFTQQDGQLITGQNPGSSEAVAECLLSLLGS